MHIHDTVDTPHTSVETPTQLPSNNQKYTSINVTDDKIDIYHSERAKLKGSTFQAFCANVKTPDDVHNIIAIVGDDSPNKLATHFSYAYNLKDEPSDGTPPSSCRDDGENDAGGTLLRLLHRHHITDVILIGIRWYGGQHVGSDRFRYFESCAVEALESMGVSLKLQEIKPALRQTKPTRPSPSINTTNNISRSRPSTIKSTPGDNIIHCVDNLVLHDSTGNPLETEKMFPSEHTEKCWAPYYDLAIRALNEYDVQKTVTLVLGVRHLRQMMNNLLSSTSFRSKVCELKNTVAEKFPNVTLIICSIIPDSTPAMIDGAAMLNSILQDIAHTSGPNVRFADTASRYTDAHNSMSGVHPKPAYIWRMGQTIYRTCVMKSPNQRRSGGGERNKLTSNDKSRRAYSSVAAPRQSIAPPASQRSANTTEDKREHQPAVQPHNRPFESPQGFIAPNTQGLNPHQPTIQPLNNMPFESPQGFSAPNTQGLNTHQPTIQPLNRPFESPQGFSAPNTQGLNPLQSLMSNPFNALAPWFAMQMMTQPWASKGSIPGTNTNISSMACS